MSRGHSDEIIAAVETHRDGVLLLVVSFDGVLVDYEGDPHSVRLSPERHQILEHFAARRDAVLGITSGRPVSDLKRSVALGEQVFYVGLHGLQVEGPGFPVTGREVVDHHRDRIHAIAAALTSRFSSVPGVRVEDKEAVLAVHTREADPRDAVWARAHLLSSIARVVRSDQMRMVRGNHVLELMPDLPNPRATAISQIRRYVQEREHQPVFTVYIGEDVPDDDALDAIGGAGISAAVGGRAPKAQYHLRSTVDVWRIIERLTAQRGTPNRH